MVTATAPMRAMIAVCVQRLRVASGRRSNQPLLTTSSYNLSWTPPMTSDTRAGSSLTATGPAAVMPSSSSFSKGSRPSSDVLCRLSSHSVGANSLARVNSVMRRWPRTARSTSVARDVDRVDPLVGDGADVTRPDLTDHPELALAGPRGHELGDSRDRSVRGRIGARPADAGRTGRCRRAPSRPRARPSGNGRAENARATVQRNWMFSVLATAPGGNPISTSTISPSPRGPSRKVGTCPPSEPAAE